MACIDIYNVVIVRYMLDMLSNSLQLPLKFVLINKINLFLAKNLY